MAFRLLCRRIPNTFTSDVFPLSLWSIQVSLISVTFVNGGYYDEYEHEKHENMSRALHQLDNHWDFNRFVASISASAIAAEHDEERFFNFSNRFSDKLLFESPSSGEIFLMIHPPQSKVFLASREDFQSSRRGIRVEFNSQQFLSRNAHFKSLKMTNSSRSPSPTPKRKRRRRSRDDNNEWQHLGGIAELFFLRALNMVIIKMFLSESACFTRKKRAREKGTLLGFFFLVVLMFNNCSTQVDWHCLSRFFLCSLLFLFASIEPEGRFHVSNCLPFRLSGGLKIWSSQGEISISITLRASNS